MKEIQVWRETAVLKRRAVSDPHGDMRWNGEKVKAQVDWAIENPQDKP